MDAGRDLTRANRRVLAFAAEHRLILAAHAAVLLGTSVPAATRRLHRLTSAGYLRHARPLAAQAWFQIDRKGLMAAGSRLPRPRNADLGAYEHDIGLAWVWLAAQRGAFGLTQAIHSERQMRSEDGRPRSEAIGPERHGVRLAGVGPHGGDRLHYPDLVLETDTGHRVAVELELTSKGRRRSGEILGGYAFDHRVDAVLYLVDQPATGRAIEQAAAKAGISHMVHVQRIAFGPGAGGISAGRTGERTSTLGPATASRECSAGPTQQAER